MKIPLATKITEKGFVNIVVIIAVLVLTGLAGYFVVNEQNFFQEPAKEITSFEECAAAGYPIMESYPEQCKTPDGRTFVRDISKESVEFESAVTFAVGQRIEFSDGLTVTLVEINDSRCKPEVVCIWAGELSPIFRITGGNAGKSLKEIRLGTSRTKSATENGYTFTLKDSAETTATIIVAKEVSTPTPDGVFCTQDAKQCPDGSYVGRTGPKCEFAKCPVTEGGDQVLLRAGEREGSLLVEKVYTDYVTGLNFMDYPVAREQGYPVTLRIGESASNGCTITLTLLRIQGGTAVFTKKTDFNRPCPICLSVNTLIDTPFGAVRVQQLQKGMPVWTVNKSGERVSGVVIATSKMKVSPEHKMVELILKDGRKLLISPGHKIIDGHTAGDLRSGDFYDGARVVSANIVTYREGYTYDILPSGETGFYFANGILLDSTLH